MGGSKVSKKGKTKSEESKKSQGARSNKRDGGDAPVYGKWTSSFKTAPPSLGIYEAILVQQVDLGTAKSISVIMQVVKEAIESDDPDRAHIVKAIILAGNGQDQDAMKGAKIPIHLCGAKANCPSSLVWHLKTWRSVTGKELRKGTHWARHLVTRLDRADELRAAYKKRVGNDDATTVMNEEPPVFQGQMDAGLFNEGPGTIGKDEPIDVDLVESARQWSSDDWKNASHSQLRFLMGSAGVPENLAKKAAECHFGSGIFGDKEPNPTADLTAALAALLKTRKKGARDSDSESSDDGKRATGREAILRAWKRKPGSLTQKALQEINELHGEIDDDYSRLTLKDLRPLFRTHVNRSESIRGTTVRNRRELQTLALALDLIVRDEVKSAADVLVQRVKALEISIMDSNWARAELIELIPPLDSGLVTREELLKVSREQKADAKYLRRTVEPARAQPKAATRPTSDFVQK